jgi:hypothetical protein
MNKRFAEENGLLIRGLVKPIKVFNADGSTNEEGSITHCTWMKLKIGEDWVETRFLITGLGKDELILGLPWLQTYNSKIDWEQRTVDIPNERTVKRSLVLVRKREDERKPTEFANDLVYGKSLLRNS